MGFSWHGSPRAVGLPAGTQRSRSEPPSLWLQHWGVELQESGASGTEAGVQEPGTSKPHRGHFRPQLGCRFDLNMRKTTATKTQPAHPLEEPLPVLLRASLGTGLIPCPQGCRSEEGSSALPLSSSQSPYGVVARVPVGPCAVPRMRLLLAEDRQERSQDAVCSRGLRRATLLIPWQEILVT